jgi:protein-disulfide isomerase
MIPMLRALSAAALVLLSILVCSPYATAQRPDRAMRFVSEFPLVGDDGQRVPNHTVKPPGQIAQLPGMVTVANAGGNTTLVEFYDLNCPFCRIASVDIGDLVDTDADLKLVLAPYPVLGAASVAASRVELAVAKLGTAQQFYKFHHMMYAERGVNDGLRALNVARELGFDERAVSALANSDQITQIMKDHFALGTALGLAATPSFIIANTAILGYPGRQSLQAIIDAAHSCGKVSC